MTRPRNTLTRCPAGLAAALLVTLSAPALADGARDAVAVDTSKVLIEQQISANDARRAGYRYLGSLGYRPTSGIGSARVRSVTREGDVWILRVAYGNGSRVQNRAALLYVDARSALVSEMPPAGIEGQVAAK